MSKSFHVKVKFEKKEGEESLFNDGRILKQTGGWDRGGDGP